MLNAHVSRRHFLRASVGAAGVLATGAWSELRAAESKSPNEKLNLGFVGANGQANFSIDNLASQNVLALCEVDDTRIAQAAARFATAKRFRDYRKMLDEIPQLDAVVVCTPDHTHAPATAAALRRGKHVYCEKPLTHTVREARTIAELAAQAKVATQMGTQIHAGDNYRQVVEIIQSGAIGKVTEVHTWVGARWGGGDRPQETPPVPATLDWQLWLGPAPERPYHSIYHPFNWRRWWDFGGGSLADMACHHMDLPFWALGLRDPLTIEAAGPPVHAETAPLGLQVRYTYAARGEQPPVTLTWYDGDRVPREIAGRKVPGGGNFFIGEKGQLWADYGSFKLYPEEQFKDFKLPEPTIPRSIGHHQEWLHACRTGEATTCNFAYASRLTEAVLLGNVAYRSGQKIEWDAGNLKIPNAAAAEKFLHKEYRKGWTL